MPARISLMLLSLVICSVAYAQSKHNGIPSQYYAYEPADGVTTREVTFYSDDVACWGKIYFPKGYDVNGSTPAVVVSHGWTGTHASLLKYGNRFADAGLVTMVIDYRGWGKSDGFVTMKDRVKTEDAARFTEATTKVQIKRTRLAPLKQVEDIRAAISYIQGEPGVNPERIGIWGSSYAGGHVMSVASMDPRVKAVVSHVPAISGKNNPKGPMPMTKAEQADAIQRAREGQGAQFKTGFTTPRMVDLETARLSKEYRPFHGVEHINDDVAILFIVAEKDELINNEHNAKAAYELLRGPKKYVEYPGIGHFDPYIEGHFVTASAEAANWYRQHLGLE